MQQKVMDREVAKQIQKNKRKQKQKQAIITFTLLIITKKLIERKLIKQQRTNFNAIQSFSTIREVKDIFHYNFKVGLQAHPLGLTRPQTLQETQRWVPK